MASFATQKILLLGEIRKVRMHWTEVSKGGTSEQSAKRRRSSKDLRTQLFRSHACIGTSILSSPSLRLAHLPRKTSDLSSEKPARHSVSTIQPEPLTSLTTKHTFIAYPIILRSRNGGPPRDVKRLKDRRRNDHVNEARSLRYQDISAHD